MWKWIVVFLSGILGTVVVLLIIAAVSDISFSITANQELYVDQNGGVFVVETDANGEKSIFHFIEGGTFTCSGFSRTVNIVAVIKEEGGFFTVKSFKAGDGPKPTDLNSGLKQKPITR